MKQNSNQILLNLKDISNFKDLLYLNEYNINNNKILENTPNSIRTIDIVDR